MNINSSEGQRRPVRSSESLNNEIIENVLSNIRWFTSKAMYDIKNKTNVFDHASKDLKVDILNRVAYYLTSEIRRKVIDINTDLNLC